MKMNQKLWLLCVSAALGLAACGGKNDAQAPAQNQAGSSVPAPEAPAQSEAPAQAEAPVAAGLLQDAQALQAAEDALKALPQFGGKALNVFQNAQFYGGSRPRIEIDIQDPNNPENIDHYTYENGQWSEPQPVKISGGGDMADNVTPLDQIKFAAVAEIAKVWHEKAVEVQAKQTEADYIYFSLFVPAQKRSWNVGNIETDRAEYELSFDQNGKLTEFKKR